MLLCGGHTKVGVMPQAIAESPKKVASDRMVSGGVVTHGFLNMQVDQANMYIAPLVICTASEDRDAEVTDPDGILDSEYRRNPLVFFNHSHKTDPSLPPIGTAETPDRQYNCFRKGNEWYSGCRFTQAAKLGTQTFALVVDGVIRGRSIGGLTHDMEPYRPKAPGKAFHKGEILPVRTKSVTRTMVELVEWSWCPIQSNRDVVTMVKSVLSRKRVDGMSLDQNLERMLRSLDLSEPEASTKNMRRTAHPLRSDVLWTTKGKNMSGPVAVRFDASEYTPSRALELIKSMGGEMKQTPLQTEEVGGALFLRSTQLDYDGEVEVVTDKRAPGLQILFAKGGYFSKQEETEEEVDPNAQPAAAAQTQESDIVEKIVNDMQGNAVVVDEAGGQQPAGAGKGADTAAVAKPAAKKKPEEQGPRGSQFLRSFAKYLEDGLSMAEAGMAEQEPELLTKCGEFVETLRAFVGKLKEAHDERYKKKPEGGPPSGEMNEEVDDEAEAEDTDDAEEAEEVDPEVAKSLRADVFYGRKKLVPKSFLASVATAQKLLASGDVDKARDSLNVVVKHFTAPVVPLRAKPPEEIRSKEELIQELQQELLRKKNLKRLASLR
jgi:hypothetical protein